MITKRRGTGDVGEGIACAFLENKGFSIIERNFQKPWGEIDIIAKRDGILHFIEVKSISVSDISREKDLLPEENVTEIKLRKLVRTVELYIEQKRMTDRQYQIDVVGVFLDLGRRKARCRLTEQVL